MATPDDFLPYKIPRGVDYSWCKTDLKETRFCYIWNIKKFSFLLEETGEYIRSSTFSSRDDDINKWYLQLYPNGEDEKCEDCVSLYLHLAEGDYLVNTVFKFSIINSKGERAHTRADEPRVFHSTGEDDSWGYSAFIRRQNLFDEKHGLLPNDELTILCDIQATGKATKSGSFSRMNIQVPKRNAAEDLGQQLFKGRNFCDVILVAEGREIPAHRAVLAFRSPVFAAMFTHDMEEKRENRVEIADIEYKIVEEMIRFVYTRGVCMLGEKVAEKLLVAADKYAIEDLKEACEKYLSMNLTSEKVTALIPLASLYNANHLKANLIDFIKSNTVDAGLNRVWDILISSHPNHAIEAFSNGTAPKKMRLS